MVIDLLEATGKLQAQIKSRRRQEEIPEVSVEECHEALRQLEQLPAAMTALLEPWAHHLERWQPSHLFFSPHFLLNLLPLHAVLWKGQPLNEYFPISYLPSAALAEEIVRRRKPIHGEALLLGNPTGDLRGAEAEVAWVKRSLEREQIDCRAFIRETATTNQMYAHAPSASIIHSACHSSLDLDDFLESGLELADRKLRAFDVAGSLQLQQAALVYLGSCDSGRAMVGRTDELMALIRVFLYAGSPAVIATLWVLDDGAGSFFADHFYKFWIADKKPMTVAFQMAMKETRNHYKNPFYWAPFVLMGG